MKIAVTGATGFIGRHVLAELKLRGIAPVVVCRPGGEVPAALAKHQVVRCDISVPQQDAFRALGEPKTLIHLAWGGLPNYRSLHHSENELPAQYRFLKTLIATGLKNVVITGTCFEYGMQFGPLHEGLETQPNNPYGFAKDTLRQQLQSLQSEIPFKLTWTRLFYLFGDGQLPNSLLPQLRDAVARGEKVFNMSGGEQLRDYLPVTQAAEILVRLATGARDNGIVNVCSGKPISVRALVEGWIRENGWPIVPSLGHYPYPDYEPMAFWGDRTKLDCCLDSN